MNISISSLGKLLDYKEFRKYSQTLIETGSGRGDGIQRALDAGFERVISIEADSENYEYCHRRFLGNTRVLLFRGKSTEVLPVLPGLFQLALCVFYLDAHPSGPKSFGHRELMDGDMSYAQDVIIRQELEIILKDAHRHVFILDDVNGHPVADDYARLIADRHSNYHFAFYDEHLAKFYKNKILVAIPEGLEE